MKNVILNPVNLTEALLYVTLQISPLLATMTNDKSVSYKCKEHVIYHLMSSKYQISFYIVSTDINLESILNTIRRYKWLLLLSKTNIGTKLDIKITQEITY